MTDAGSRRDDARRRVEMEALAARGEAIAAQRLIDEFVAEAGRRGLQPRPLRATLYNGKQVKTDKVGWYLNRSGSLAIGDDGRYYRLIVAGTPLARFVGVQLQPCDPSLSVGKGGRDGESGDLSDFLAKVLDPPQ